MTKVTLLASFLLFAGVVSIQVSPDFCTRHYNRCRFRFDGANEVPTILFYNTAGGAVYPAIRSSNSNETVGLVVSTGRPAEIINGYYYLPIKYDASQLKFSDHPVRPSFLHWYRYGMGHERLTDEQKKHLKGKCVRVWITNYKLVSFESGRPKVVETRDNVEECIVFKPSFPGI